MIWPYAYETYVIHKNDGFVWKNHAEVVREIDNNRFELRIQRPVLCDISLL
jgi:hypothetical protein